MNDDFGRLGIQPSRRRAIGNGFPFSQIDSAFDIVGLGEEAIGLPKITTLSLKKKVLAAAIADNFVYLWIMLKNAT